MIENNMTLNSTNNQRANYHLNRINQDQVAEWKTKTKRGKTLNYLFPTKHTIARKRQVHLVGIKAERPGVATGAQISKIGPFFSAGSQVLLSRRSDLGPVTLWGAGVVRTYSGANNWQIIFGNFKGIWNHIWDLHFPNLRKTACRSWEGRGGEFGAPRWWSVWRLWSRGTRPAAQRQSCKCRDQCQRRWKF